MKLARNGLETGHGKQAIQRARGIFTREQTQQFRYLSLQASVCTDGLEFSHGL